MADNSKIEWTDATWNPITGCSVVSPGCTNCYAMRLAGTRLQHHPSRSGLTTPSKAGPVWTGEVRLNEQWIYQPLLWRKPRRIFVCAHSDLFGENVPDAWIDQVFAVMTLSPQHTFQVLTKRSARMRAWVASACGRVSDSIQPLRTDTRAVGPVPHLDGGERWWPLPNVHLYVSCEDQQRAAERIPDLLATPAAVRGVSLEPLLGPINLRPIRTTNAKYGTDEPASIYALDGKYQIPGSHWSEDYLRLDHVIVGGESGPAARPMNPDWARSLRAQCAGAGVPFFMKQMARKAPIPEDLMVREWPR